MLVEEGRRSTGENSWNAASSSVIASRSACTWNPPSVAPMSSRMLCSVRDATIGSARPSTKTLVRRLGPRSSSIGISPTIASERQYLP